jgi:hypothetical protein
MIPMQQRYWLVARDKPGLLVAVMRALAGGAHISLEGDFSRARGLLALSGASTEETEALHRQTTYPLQDFVVLPLEPESITPILNEILPEARVVRHIIHVQIERGGRLEFGAYDNFHRDCVVCWAAVPQELLRRLQVSGVLRSWEPAPADGHRWHD